MRKGRKSESEINAPKGLPDYGSPSTPKKILRIEVKSPIVPREDSLCTSAWVGKPNSMSTTSNPKVKFITVVNYWILRKRASCCEFSTASPKSTAKIKKNSKMSSKDRIEKMKTRNQKEEKCQKEKKTSVRKDEKRPKRQVVLGHPFAPTGKICLLSSNLCSHESPMWTRST